MLMATAVFSTPAYEEVSACLICCSAELRDVDRDFHFRQCASCGFIFDSPRPTLSTLVDFYSSGSKYDPWLDNCAAREKLWKRRLNKMLPSAHRRGSLL